MSASDRATEHALSWLNANASRIATGAIEDAAAQLGLVLDAWRKAGERQERTRIVDDGRKYVARKREVSSFSTAHLANFIELIADGDDPNPGPSAVPETVTKDHEAKP